MLIPCALLVRRACLRSHGAQPKPRPSSSRRLVELQVAANSSETAFSQLRSNDSHLPFVGLHSDLWSTVLYATVFPHAFQPADRIDISAIPVSALTRAPRKVVLGTKLPEW